MNAETHPLRGFVTKKPRENKASFCLYWTCNLHDECNDDELYFSVDVSTLLNHAKSCCRSWLYTLLCSFLFLWSCEGLKDFKEPTLYDLHIILINDIHLTFHGTHTVLWKLKISTTPSQSVSPKFGQPLSWIICFQAALCKLSCLEFWALFTPKKN